jgi:hypothetical protein
VFSLMGRSLVATSELFNLFLFDEKLSFKRLDTERDFEILQREFERADGTRLPTDYLKQGRAFICFNEHLVPQGGFALIDKGPFRTLQQIPGDAAQPVEAAMTEITGVCLLPGHPLRRTRFWSYVVGQTLCGHSSRIVYAVDARKSALRDRIFNHIRAHTLYEGPVKRLDGMVAETIEAVELTTKVRLAKGFLRLAFRETEKLRPQFLKN